MLVRSVLALLLLFLLVPVSFSADVRPKSITVVLDDNYPPYIFRDSAGQIQGVLVDGWALWSSRTGIKVNLQAMDWAKAQQVMQKGQADVIDTIFLTEPRQKIYDFSKPYASIEVPIFFHSSINGIADADSLHGFLIGVKDGDACIEKLQDHKVTNLQRYPSYESLINSAARHEIRVFCVDKPPASYFLYKLGLEREFRHSMPLYVGEFHRAVHKGNKALLKVVEDGFASIPESEFRKIEEKWFGSTLDKKLQPLARYAVYVLLGVLGLALILGLWNLTLRRRVLAKTSELREAKQLAEKTLDSLTATLEAIPDLLFEMDAKGIYYSYRAAHSSLLQPSADHMVGRKVSEVMPPDAAAVVIGALREAAEKGGAQGAQFPLDLAEGRCWFELSVARKKMDDKAGERFVVLSRNITERKRAEEEIERLAFFDPLTRLPNRRFLIDRLQRGLATSARRGSFGAVFFIDLDNFKTLNDTQGHQIGDLLLLEVAHRLQSCVRIEDCVARMGGDEFVIVLEDLSRHSHEAAVEAETVGQKVLDQVGKSFLLDGFEYHCTASIGVTLFSGGEEGVDELLKRADAAMYRAKMAGRNTLRFFDPAMQASLEAHALLEAELRRALPDNQFELFYQAQVDSSSRTLGVEALLRWRHPLRGLVEPMQFIPLAEESGLIVPIGHWVLEAACAQLKRWENSPLTRHLRLSVNLSARQFRQRDFVSLVQGVISRSGIDPTQLILEITESTVLDSVADSVDKMQALKSVGVSFSMDDFGMGYSSLSYLKRLPLDQLKIDRAFVRDIVTDPCDAVIVQTIIGMARNFGLNVIAEGVETEAQRVFLLANGCTEFQGFLFGRPVPLCDFEAQLN